MNPNNRIIGGTKARTPIPWQVQVRERLDTKIIDCGGTILDKFTILTAAHCEIYKNWYIIAGAKSSKPRPQIRRVKKVINHSQYERKNDNNGVFSYFKNDICIVKLYKPLKFKKNVVRNACLPKSYFATPSRGVVSGWGLTKPSMYHKVASINTS